MEFRRTLRGVWRQNRPRMSLYAERQTSDIKRGWKKAYMKARANVEKKRLWKSGHETILMVTARRELQLHFGKCDAVGLCSRQPLHLALLHRPTSVPWHKHNDSLTPAVYVCLSVQPQGCALHFGSKFNPFPPPRAGHAATVAD